MLRASREIKFAVIADAQGRADGDHGYTLYYVAGDKDQYGEGRWILEDNAGVTCTNYNLTDVYRNQGEELDAEGDRLEAEINAIIEADAGEVSTHYAGTGTQGGAGSEAEGLMVQWGWLQPQIRVQYSSGESRQHPGKAIDYMLADVDGTELYAEAEPVEGDETATYEDLAAEILSQAVAAGIDVTRLEWHMDSPLLTTAQAADILGLSVQRIKQLCAAGRMGRRVGRDWVISVADIEANRVRKPAGRPPGRAVTQDNVEDIRHEVGFLDLAAEVQVGQRVSVHRFTHEGGQSGCCLVVHADKDGRVDRAGISFGGPGAWGDWDEATQTVRLDEADEDGLTVVYRTDGRRVVEE